MIFLFLFPLYRFLRFVNCQQKVLDQILSSNELLFPQFLYVFNSRLFFFLLEVDPSVPAPSHGDRMFASTENEMQSKNPSFYYKEVSYFPFYLCHSHDFNKKKHFFFINTTPPCLLLRLKKKKKRFYFNDLCLFYFIAI